MLDLVIQSTADLRPPIRIRVPIDRSLHLHRCPISVSLTLLACESIRWELALSIDVSDDEHQRQEFTATSVRNREQHQRVPAVQPQRDQQRIRD